MQGCVTNNMHTSRHLRVVNSLSTESARLQATIAPQFDANNLTHVRS
jgi:hypothetical protein